MKEFMREINQNNHYRALEIIKKRKPLLLRRTDTVKHNKSMDKTSKIFKTGGYFKIRGEYVNEDLYFDEAFKVNKILAKKLSVIDNRK